MPHDPVPPEGKRSVLVRTLTRVVGLFDSVGKVSGTLLGLVALAGVLGVIGRSSGDAREASVEKSEVRVSATVRSLRRQDDEQSANDYAPDNVLDADHRTAWVEGVPGTGVGAKLRFLLPRTVHLTRIVLVDGYAKSAAAALDNAAARTIRIWTDGRRPIVRTLKRDTRPQSVRADFGRTRHVTIEVLSAWSGDRFDDLAVSEVTFFARVE